MATNKIRGNRTLLATAMAASLLLGAAGCAREGGAEASKDSGVVHVVCGATEDWCAATTKKFTESTGVKADFVRLSSGEALARIKAGKGNAEFDVWYGGPPTGTPPPATRGSWRPTPRRTRVSSRPSTRTRRAPGPASTSAPWASAATASC